MALPSDVGGLSELIAVAMVTWFPFLFRKKRKKTKIIIPVIIHE